LFFWHDTQDRRFFESDSFFQIPRPGDSFDFEIVSNIWNQRLVDSDFFNTRNPWVLLKSITHHHIGFGFLQWNQQWGCWFTQGPGLAL
jgi:hypothetical protein